MIWRQKYILLEGQEDAKLLSLNTFFDVENSYNFKVDLSLLKKENNF